MSTEIRIAIKALTALRYGRIEESNRLFALGYRELAEAAAREAGRLAFEASELERRT